MASHPQNHTLLTEMTIKRKMPPERKGNKTPCQQLENWDEMNTFLGTDKITELETEN